MQSWGEHEERGDKSRKHGLTARGWVKCTAVAAAVVATVVVVVADNAAPIATTKSSRHPLLMPL